MVVDTTTRACPIFLPWVIGTQGFLMEEKLLGGSADWPMVHTIMMHKATGSSI